MILENHILLAFILFFSLLTICFFLKIKATKKKELELINEKSKLLDNEIQKFKNQLPDTYSSANTWQNFKHFVVLKKHVESWTFYKGNRISDICSFVFSPKDTPLPLPSFHPGQHLSFDLTLEDGSKKTMYYSLSDGPNSNTFRVSIKRALPPPRVPDAPPGIGSNFFHDHINEGDLVKTALPKGDFYLDANKNSEVVLVAGGIGITPMVSIAKYLTSVNSSRPIHLYYGVRHLGEVALVNDLLALSDNSPHINIYLCLSDPHSEVKADCAQSAVTAQAADEINKLSKLKSAAKVHFVTGFTEEGQVLYTSTGKGCRVGIPLMKHHLDPTEKKYDFYLCGPPPMMSSIVTGLYQWDLPKDCVHWEGFGPCAVMWPGDILNSPLKPCSITFQETKSDEKYFIDWQVANGSLMNLADSSGGKIPKIPRSCGAGWCGTCKSSFKGKVHYDEKPGYSNLRDNECLPCICKPDGDVIINLKA